MDKKNTQNYYFLPLIISLLQFFLLCIRFTGSGIFFSKKLFLFSVLIIIFWLCCFVYKAVKLKSFSITLKNLFFLIICVLIGFYLVGRIWGSQYLRLGAVEEFFDGSTFIDTLYHSSIVGSIKTNGYPSILQNGSDVLYYHCFAHYLIAGLAFIFNVPAFIALNYFYPIVFLPVFGCFIFKIASIAKKTFSGNSELTIGNYLFISAILAGFMTKRFADQTGLFLYSSIYSSESSFISLIFGMTYFVILDSIKEKKNCESINQYFLIPVFILILSFSKISTGAIFCAGACYYFFRRYFYKDKKWFLCIAYAAIFLVYYKLMSKSASFPNSEPSLNESSIFLFHFVRMYTENLLYSLLHYLILFIPLILLCAGINKNLLIALREKKYIFIEISIVITFVSCLPGILLKIDGGSAFYFTTPAFLFSCFVLLGYGVGVFNRCNKHLKTVMLVVLFFSLAILQIKESNFIGLIKDVIYERCPDGFYRNFPKSLPSLFREDKTCEKNEYKMFCEIYKRIEKNPKDFCVFLEDDYTLYDAYRNFELQCYGGKIPQIGMVKPDLCISAWLGIPVINSIYLENNIFYRGDGAAYGKYSDFAGYSMPPKTCGSKITRQNATKIAAKLNKKHIIFINKDNYDILTVNN